MFERPTTFPPYELLDEWATRAGDKTERLEKLYHNTRDYSWDPRTVLDELETKHGGIQVPEHLREPLGHLFSVLLWGELAAWNIAADLARELPDVDAKMAATGQVFDEARHFTVLREYFRRANIQLPRINPYGERMLRKILNAPTIVEKLYGMQLTVENMALAIFKRIAAANVEPVLTDLLEYIERDESRHVALGVLYLPKLLGRTSAVDRARNFVFNFELFLLTVGGGELLDPHLVALGIDHRILGVTVSKLHQQVTRRMAEEQGLPEGEAVRGVYGLSGRQHQLLTDFLHPVDRSRMSPAARLARGVFHEIAVTGARLLH
ncbi:MAG TPA: ferritin-like domain-containing protein [Polyangiaceae bacterium]|nr:ferritin-like domain-containing protein [Polyangiaceae bacterium]